MDFIRKIKRRIHEPRLIKRDIRFFFQRLTRGFDDSTTWSLDYSLPPVILPRLKRFKEVTIAVPQDMTQEEWHEILDKMIAAFEFAGSDARWEATPGDFEKYQEGLDLFAKYYFLLWW